MLIIDTDAPINVPDEIAVCPICGAAIWVEVTEWEHQPDGTWAVSDCGVYTNCASEPDINSDEWKDWHNGHYAMPYVDWLPVDLRITKWLKRTYRFNMT